MKVLLIEDRQQRQEQFLAKTEIDISKCTTVNNKIGTTYQEFRKEILENNKCFDDYQVIISHRSAFDKDNSKVIDLMEDYCMKNNKQLVLFSGGIYTSFYSEEPFKKLVLNSKLLYSQNLKLFLDNLENNSEVNLLLLAYGKNWKINLLLNILEKINLFILKFEDLEDEDKSYEYLNDEINIEIIESQIDLSNIKDNDTITTEDLEILKNNILDNINDKLEIYNV